MLYSFNILVQRLPIKYATFAYRRCEFDDLTKLTARMKRDISGLLFDHLDFFQAFDDVKVYYDNGQDIVKRPSTSPSGSPSPRAFWSDARHR